MTASVIWVLLFSVEASLIFSMWHLMGLRNCGTLVNLYCEWCCCNVLERWFSVADIVFGMCWSASFDATLAYFFDVLIVITIGVHGIETSSSILWYSPFSIFWWALKSSVRYISLMLDWWYLNLHTIDSTMLWVSLNIPVSISLDLEWSYVDPGSRSWRVDGTLL